MRFLFTVLLLAVSISNVYASTVVGSYSSSAAALSACETDKQLPTYDGIEDLQCRVYSTHVSLYGKIPSLGYRTFRTYLICSENEMPENNACSTCPEGQTYSEELGQCVCTTSSENCETEPDESCPEGYKKDLYSGECILDCEENQISYNDETCETCPFGMIPSRSFDSCVYPDCPNGQAYDYQNSECVSICPENSSWDQSQQKCNCPDNEIDNGSSCEECPDGTRFNNGICDLDNKPCPNGLEWQGTFNGSNVCTDPDSNKDTDNDNPTDDDDDDDTDTSDTHNDGSFPTAEAIGNAVDNSLDQEFDNLQSTLNKIEDNTDGIESAISSMHSNLLDSLTDNRDSNTQGLNKVVDAINNKNFTSTVNIDFSTLTTSMSDSESDQLTSNATDAKNESLQVIETLDSFNDLTTNDFKDFNESINPVENFVSSYIPSGSCSDISISLPVSQSTIDFTCADAKPIRDTLSYFGWILILIYSATQLTERRNK